MTIAATVQAVADEIEKLDDVHQVSTWQYATDDMEPGYAEVVLTGAGPPTSANLVGPQQLMVTVRVFLLPSNRTTHYEVLQEQIYRLAGLSPTESMMGVILASDLRNTVQLDEDGVDVGLMIHPTGGHALFTVLSLQVLCWATV